MAISLASGSSSNEHQNLSNLLILCSAATDALNVDFRLTDTSEKNKLSNNAKKQVKKSACVLTLDEVRRLPVKSLIDKFSEMTSDELTKKYSYKCLLIPDECNTTYKSYGSDKKACDQMKRHLIKHIEELISKREANNDVFNSGFVPRSPSTSPKQTEKISKKSVKKHQISLQIAKAPNPALSRSNVLKMSRSVKNNELRVKKIQRKSLSNKKYVAEIKNGLNKVEARFFNSVYLEKNNPSQDFSDDSYLSDEEPIRESLDEESTEDLFCNTYYSNHLKNIIFSNDAAKEKLSDSENETVSQLNDSGSFHDEDNMSTNNLNFDVFYKEHDYTAVGVFSYCEPPSPSRGKLTKVIKKQTSNDASNKPVSSLIDLVIRTPPFPFIHVPLLPEVSQIIEIGEVECNCGADCCEKSLKKSPGTSTIKKEVEEMQTDEPMSDSEEKFSSAFYKMNGASSSVLECVDNIVNNKPSSSCVPKNEISANENDENLNMQKFEKELALKYIAKLHSKGKKKIPDSLMCQICPDKHFTAQATLIHHYRSHAGIKPYICNICSAKFTRQHSLNYHTLIHQNRIRFTCEFCDRTFRHPSHFKEHLRRHTGETPYHCTDCNLHFKTRNTFKRHLKARHGKLLTAGGIEDLNNDDNT